MGRHGPFVLQVPGLTFRFELRDIGGPFVLGKQGYPLADQPGPRSVFWEAYWHWDRQGRQVDDQGRCIFGWETALVSITKKASQPLPGARTTTPAPPTARVLVNSIPPDAEIFADGRFVGTTPTALTLRAGKHEFRVVLEGYREWTRELELIADSDQSLTARLLERAPENNP